MMLINPLHRLSGLEIRYGNGTTQVLLQDWPVMFANIVGQQPVTDTRRSLVPQTLTSAERPAEIAGSVRFNTHDLGRGIPVGNGKRMTCHQSTATHLAEEMRKATTFPFQLLNDL